MDKLIDSTSHIIRPNAIPGLFFRIILLTLTVLALGSCVTPVPPQVHKVIVNDRVVGEATNDVQIIRAGVATPAGPGSGLEVGDEIKTGPNSQAVLLLENGAVEITILENSELRISSIFVKLGEVFVRVKKKLAEKFEVESEYGVAVVEGTEFIVSVRRDVDYRCLTLDGRVEVHSATGSWPTTSVTAREEFTVNAGATPRERTLDRNEYNAVVKRVNDVERIYRPGSAQYLVPDVTGLTEAEARRVLDRMELRVGEVTGRVTDRARIGEVLNQTPRAGQRTRPNRPVNLEVEAEPTTVPKITGMQKDNAIRALGRARLVLGEVREEITGNSPVGEVFRQQPGQGERVPVESTVDLWVEADQKRVPQVVKSNIQTARQMLTDAGLQVGSVSEKLVEGVADGTVLEQSVAANKPVAPGTRVNLVVAERGVPVPNLINNSQRGATRVLAGAGLKLGSVGSRESQAKEGAVIEQSPRAGDLIRPGGAVSITIAKARQCTVPSVVDLTPAGAVSRIKSAGFNAQQGGRGACANDLVTGQNPPAGTTTRCGSTVRYDTGYQIC